MPFDFWMTVVEVLVWICGLAVAAIFVFLIADYIDQSRTKGVLHRSVRIVDKQSDSGTRSMLVGETIMPMHYEDYTLSFLIGGKKYDAQVEEGDYRKAKIGDKLDVEIREGKLSIGVYPRFGKR